MLRPVLEAEIASRTGYSLPVDQADAVTRRISGYIAVNAAEDMRWWRPADGGKACGCGLPMTHATRLA
jgi:hypothetical protein